MSGPSSRANELTVRAVGSVLVLLLRSASFGCSKSAGSGAATPAARARARRPLRVAAAADLALAFKEVGAAFEKESGKHVDFSFGSTGLLAEQLSEGAPFDVFAAANVSYVDDVVREGACLGETKALYAKGRIVMWSKDPWALPKDINDLKDPKYSKVAIANPEHCTVRPRGARGDDEGRRWTTAVQPRAVYSEERPADADVRAFRQCRRRDRRPLARGLSRQLRADRSSLHEPLDQALVVCKGGPKGAKTNEARTFVQIRWL